MKNFIFIILGGFTSFIVYYSDISVSYSNFIYDKKHLLSFSIVALIAGYAYYFIHKAFLLNKGNEGQA